MKSIEQLIKNAKGNKTKDKTMKPTIIEITVKAMDSAGIEKEF